ncbi:MAG: IS200/IS605 family transposase, partial [Eubacterium sp.]|nr:IS200/IS605 family transposase [Eubacterium sp.]
MIKKNGNNEIETLSHSTYRCQYHIVFAPKYR